MRVTVGRTLFCCMAGAAVAALATSGAASAQALTDTTIQDLSERIARIEEREARAVTTTSGIRLSISGFVKTDFILDTDQALGDTFAAGGIATGGTGGDSRFTAHARQTRLSFRTESDTGRGPLNTLIELDLFGSRASEIFSNSHQPRLRHAMIEWDRLIVGQFWTNFMPIEVYPTTVDFEGPAGIPFIRQAQIRYTHPVSPDLTLSASLENSEFNGRTADAVFSESTTSGIRAGLDRVPDFTLAATWRQDWGLVKLAGVGRYFNSPTSSDTAFGWGLNLSGQVNLWEGGSAMASVTGGDGIGRYIINGFGQDAFVDEGGRIDTITSWGATVGLSHAFTPTLTGAVTGGVYRVEDTFAATDTREIRTVHLSTFYRPVERLTLGGEVIYGQRETADGRTGDNVRLQAALQVNF
jgi:hypothetical protein